LHPLLGDLARRIGGNHVQVVDLLQANGNLHSFEPSPRLIAEASGAQFLIASGKNLEPYLASLSDALRSGIQPLEVVNVGSAIPDVLAAGQSEDHHHGDADEAELPEESASPEEHHHHHGPNDPHWWNSPENMRRAGRLLCHVFRQADPDHATDYNQALSLWIEQMDGIEAWAKCQLATIPDEHRILVTGHAAMSHFCKALDFTEVPVQGISREDEGNPERLARTLHNLRLNGALAVFPEYGSNPKILESISSTLHLPLADALVTDGLAPQMTNFEAMFRHNVTVIKKALEPTQQH
jgi:ABC-type Zn uptake system ZnuABC Zn-binding protein ZnuA